MLRRGGAPPKKPILGGGPASSQHYNSGGVHRKKKKTHSITAKAFSYIRTEFGALRSRRLAVNPVEN